LLAVLLALRLGRLMSAPKLNRRHRIGSSECWERPLPMHHKKQAEVPRWVTTGKAQTEHNISDFTPIASEKRRSFISASCHKVPFARSKQHPYSITSSARSRIDVGSSISSALAVFRLMTSSNLFGCSTGMSPGLVPVRILATYRAAWRCTAT
jgi:hypothetical protein